jgi:hypothetical protein
MTTTTEDLAREHVSYEVIAHRRADFPHSRMRS